MTGVDSRAPGRSVVVVHPSSELYGSDRVALESVTAFVEAGWTVRTILSSDGPLGPLIEKAGSPVWTLAVPVLRKSALSPVGAVRLLVALCAALPRMWRVLRETRPDAVYVSTVTVPWWLLAARLCGAAVICHVHEAEEHVPRPVRLGLALPLLLAHRVVTNSLSSRDVLVRDLRRLGDRIHVIYNGVPGPNSPVHPAVEPSGTVRLVLVGRLSPRKGTDVAVRAVAQLVERGRDVQLELVGDVFPGYEWFADEVHATALAAGVADRVTWRGVLPDVWDALARSDVALVPSRVEPFGNAAVEALLAARPLVASDTQGLREIVQAGRNGELVPPGDAGALADAIEQVVAHWPQSLSRASAARVDAEQRYSPDRYRTDIAAELAAAAATAAPTRTPAPFRTAQPPLQLSRTPWRNR